MVPTVNMQQAAKLIQTNVHSCCDQSREFAFEYMYCVLYFVIFFTSLLIQTFSNK